jgi:hypothetical protein
MKKRIIINLGVLILGLFSSPVFGGTEGATNTFYGLNAGDNTTGAENTFIGAAAGVNNTSGVSNTFLGYHAGVENTTGYENTFLGRKAGHDNTTGYANTFLGHNAGFCNTTGYYNTFIGNVAGVANTTGYENTFLGRSAGGSNTTGYDNTFIGRATGYGNTTGSKNTFLGRSAGGSNTTGYDNTFIGQGTGYGNTTGYANIFIGRVAGAHNTTGIKNIFLGLASGVSNTTGSANTFLGYASGAFNFSGTSNVFLGCYAGINETGSERLYIANSDTNTPLIYGEFDNQVLTVNGDLNMFGPNGRLLMANTSADNTTKVGRIMVGHYSNSQMPFYLIRAASNATANLLALGGGNSGGNAATQIDFYTAANTTTPTGKSRLTIKSNGYIGLGTKHPTEPLQMASGAYVTTGGVWTNASSRKYKDHIQSLSAAEALAALKELNPVKYVYKADKTEKHVGFIAEDVPELLATKDRKGLSAMDIVAVLTKALQEQQKTIREHQKIAQVQQSTIEKQQKAIQELSNKITVLEKEFKLKGNLANASF